MSVERTSTDEKLGSEIIKYSAIKREKLVKSAKTKNELRIFSTEVIISDMSKEEQESIQEVQREISCIINAKLLETKIKEKS